MGVPKLRVGGQVTGYLGMAPADRVLDSNPGLQYFSHAYMLQASQFRPGYAMQPDLPARSRRHKDDHQQWSEAEPLVCSSQGARAPAGQAREILDGLASPVARVSPKYFYDRLGSTLFDAITALPEYYLTRTELGLLRKHAIEIRVNAGRALPIKIGRAHV